MQIRQPFEFLHKQWNIKLDSLTAPISTPATLPAETLVDLEGWCGSGSCLSVGR